MILSRLLIVVLALALLSPVTARAETTKVTFVLTSDIYQMNEQTLADGKARGGFARLAAVVKAERAKGTPVIVAHAGDTFSPSLMSGFDRGAHIVALTNMIAPDIFVPGNHEFDFGKAAFLQRIGEARFPLYAANLRAADGSPLPGFRDHTILTFNGVKIGITAAAYDDTPRASNSEDLRFAPTIETIKNEAAALRQDGADFVVAVVHSGRGEDYALNATGAVDLILTGHDHDLFVNYDERSAIVESSYDAHFVVVVEAAIEIGERDGRRTMKWWPTFRVIDTATVTPDPEVAVEIGKYEKELSRELDVTIGSTAVELDSRNSTVRSREAAIGNLFADAMRASAKADVALMNGGGIRAGHVYAPGTPITRRDVLAELPFNNRVVTVEIVGRELRRAVERSFRTLPDATGSFLQVSGLTIEVDRTRPPGSRVLAIKAGSEPLDDAKTYTAAINDFLARGGDGYDMLRDAKHLLPTDDSPLVANEVMTYVRRIGTIQTGVEGRIVFR